jgi:predicted RNA-binding protein YlxR (DUF448 family)
LGRIGNKGEIPLAKIVSSKVKHIPQRTCVGCHQVLPKRSLIRIVRTPDGIMIDPTGKVNGRGAYIHDRKSCWERALKGTIAHSLRIELDKKNIELLQAFLATLPENSDEAPIASSQSE